MVPFTLLLTILFAIMASGTIAAETSIDCDACFGMYDFCVQNGHTEGQTGCKQTCVEHVCHLHSECMDCGNEFNLCPDVSRYPN